MLIVQVFLISAVKSSKQRLVNCQRGAEVVGKREPDHPAMAAQSDVVRDRQIQSTAQAQPQTQPGDGKSSSRTVTDTIIGMKGVGRSGLSGTRYVKRNVSSAYASSWLGVLQGEHEHTIVGYSLVKGIGDGEPIASERFSVGGHEWVWIHSSSAFIWCRQNASLFEPFAYRIETLMYLGVGSLVLS